ncbi:zinc finger MYM-type protein 3 isoform X2 [Nilaparvata lugens]|uniref:zinc finger MYM-type protein 3 isoform X2 n=1 Tax=Nilaparvata lugens TaxID=108931 RepID=UPI00193DF9C7|nr:zinc finger MYM-type protein 3 isoform X2 [Nilaparvata lugens]
MENDQKDGSTEGATTTNLKTVGTPVVKKSAVDGEVDQNSVANCNKSEISDSASDVPVSNDKTDNGPVESSEIASNSEKLNNSVDKTVERLSDSLDNSLRDDSVGSSRMEQTLMGEKSEKDVVDVGTPKSDSLLAEMRQICNKTVADEEAMDVDESLTIPDDGDSASKLLEAPKTCSSIIKEGEKLVETGSKLKGSVDQDDSNLGLDESSTNMSETCSKFVLQDCDQDLSQDEVQDVNCIDPFAQTGDESMEVDEVVDDVKEKEKEKAEEKESRKTEEEKESEEKEEEKKEGEEKRVEEEKVGDDEGELDKDGGKKDSGEKNEEESGEVKKVSEEKRLDESGDGKVVENEVEEDGLDEAMEVDGKLQSKPTEEKDLENEEKNEEDCVEKLSEESVDKDAVKESENNSSKDVLNVEKGENSSSKEVESIDKDESSSNKKVVSIDEDGNSSSKEVSTVDKDGSSSSKEVVTGEEIEKSSTKKLVADKDKNSSSKEVDNEEDDCVLVVEDGEKKGESEEKKGEEEQKTKEESSTDGGKKSGDKVSETPMIKVISLASSSSLSSNNEDGAAKKTEGKEADKGGSAEIEIDEDICIIPDTVRLPPGKDGKNGSTPSTPVASTSGNKVLNEVSSFTNRIKVVKMETEVKQESPTSSRPKRQAATKADAQIKATVKEFELYNDEEEREKENEEDDNKLCKQCQKVKPCKFNILNKNKVVSHLCSEECVHGYKNALLAADRARGVGGGVPSSPAGAASGPVGRASSGTGGGSSSGGGNVHINEAGEFERACSQCRSALVMGESVLSWETMDFCNEDCLSKYQNCLGSHCAYCSKSVQQSSLGKYCVRFGYHIRQFCSANCLEEYKRGLKVCSFCQKDISSLETGFLAPVGDKGTFKDFCTQQCMEQYDRLSNNQPAPAETHPCDVCNETKLVCVQVAVDSKLSKLCSEVCFAAFKFVNEVTVDECDMCHKHFDRNTLRSDNLTVFYDDKQYNFCCKSCMNAYILGKRKIVPCNWCKVKKYNFDMIKRVLESGQTLMMCSLNCLTLYKVSINAVSSRRIKCDNCGSVSQAQYHLTMSDATIRNFCTYPCVMNFQGQYSKNPITLPGGQQTPIPTGGPKRAITTVNATKDTRTGSVPVIQSVTSLATTNGQVATSLLQSSPTVNSLSPAVSSVKSVTVTKNSAGIVSVGVPAGGAATGSVVPGVAPGAATTTSCQTYVMVRERCPPAMANKATFFRPTSHTKGVSCRPHATSQATQTDVSGRDGKTVMIPIPVPVYIPVPVHMYSMPTPVPVPFPIPVPVPVFIPTTRNSAQGIMDEIKRIHEKIPTDPFEAELLMMAQAVAEEKRDASGSEAEAEGVAANSDREVSPDRQSDSPGEAMMATNDVDAGGADTCDGDNDVTSSISCDVTLDDDLDSQLTPSTITPTVVQQSSENEEDVDDPGYGETPPPAKRGKRGRPFSVRGGGYTGAKRGRRPGNHVLTHTNSSEDGPVLKYILGVQAYKQWVQARNSNYYVAESSPNRRVPIKPDLLKQKPEELAYSMTLFVREARKPSGAAYPADTIYYFCLGIQYYLFDNGRSENIFTDALFEAFTVALEERLQSFPSALEDAPSVVVTRVEEEHLWESKQLGAHSPHVLLCTLMFFNTKYFNLVTAEDHMKLSLSQIMKHWKKPGNNAPVTGTRNVLLRYYPVNVDSAKRSSGGKRLLYEQHENETDPLRCPVKLYEFYLSKCPESVKSKGELFYLQPERSCVPDSPVWYSTQALAEESLTRVLNRLKMVKEINIAVLKV